MHPRILSSLTARLALVPRWRLVLGLALPPLLVMAALAGVLVYGGPSTPASPRVAGGAAPAVGPAPAAAAAGGDAEAATALPPAGGLLIDVSGAVAHPGVYRVAKGERAVAAIAAAGGLTADADPTRLPSMAGLLKDGQQIRVPARTSPARSPTVRSIGTGLPRAAWVSLNAATAEELATVPGFTPDLVAAVIRYRTEYGGFATTRELVDILQMSEADFQVARRYVSV
ncbi:MAG TPA: helix-hairpin-helix domain-containing protein [Candidatus Dormibacteraeota bacterium]